jgi:hypothetical protein
VAWVYWTVEHSLVAVAHSPEEASVVEHTPVDSYSIRNILSKIKIDTYIYASG